MQTIRKKLITIRSISALALVLLIVLGSAWAAGRRPVSGSVEVYLDPEPGFIVEGKYDVSLTIGGDVFEGTVVVEAGKTEQRGGGGLHFYGFELTFTATSGNFKGAFDATFDGIATPTNDKSLYNLSGYMEITGGTVDFERACGRLSVHGKYNVITKLASFEVHGAIGL